MMRLIMTVLIAGAFMAPAIAQGQRALRRPDAPARGPAPPAPIEDLIERFYVNQLRLQVELTDEQFAKAAPMLRLALRERREIGVRRARTMNQLRKAVESGASDEELKQHIDAVDQSNTDTQASQDACKGATLTLDLSST